MQHLHRIMLGVQSPYSVELVYGIIVISGTLPERDHPRELLAWAQYQSYLAADQAPCSLHLIIKERVGTVGDGRRGLQNCLDTATQVWSCGGIMQCYHSAFPSSVDPPFFFHGETMQNSIPPKPCAVIGSISPL